MAATKTDLLARLETLGISAKTVEHAALFTVEQSRALRGEIPGGHSKNLFLKDKKGQIFLVVALEDSEIDLKRLHTLLNCGRLSFGRPELLAECLGVVPGSVTPFALINDQDRRVNVVLDQAMFAHDRLNFHPLTNEATTTIGRDDLIRFIHACGHQPRIVDLSVLGKGG